MKVTVIRAFIDKETGKKYNPGDSINLKKARVDEILAAGEFLKVESKNKEADPK